MEQKKWIAWREVDALVERYVFHREFVRYSGWRHTDMSGVIATPKYSTDIVAAWQVIDHMQKDLEWQFIIEAHSGAWSVLITPHVSSVDYGRIEYEGWADTIQLAICLAALRAVGGFRSRGCEMQCNHELKSNGIRGGMTYFCIGDKSHSGEHTYWINGKEKRLGMRRRGLPTSRGRTRGLRKYSSMRGQRSMNSQRVSGNLRQGTVYSRTSVLPLPYIYQRERRPHNVGQDNVGD